MSKKESQAPYCKEVTRQSLHLKGNGKGECFCRGEQKAYFCLNAFSYFSWQDKRLEYRRPKGGTWCAWNQVPKLVVRRVHTDIRQASEKLHQVSQKRKKGAGELAQ